MKERPTEVYRFEQLPKEIRRMQIVAHREDGEPDDGWTPDQLFVHLSTWYQFNPDNGKFWHKLTPDGWAYISGTFERTRDMVDFPIEILELASEFSPGGIE